MRRVRSIALPLLAAAALAGCGSSSPTTSPLSSALSYFARNSPFVMSVITDPHAEAVKSAQAMLSRLTLFNFGQAAAISRLQQLGINYDTDIRPLFGNPLIVGVQSAGGGAQKNLLAAWITKDAGTLAALIKKLHLLQVGTHGGATLYQVSSLTLAVDGATLVAGGAGAVNAALDRHSAGNGMTPDDYNRDLGSLPKSALIDAVGDLSSLLASPKATQAKRVPWFAALRGYGVAISAGSGGLSFQYTLDTNPSQLSSAELPIAPGTSPPGLTGNLPIQLGLRQPALLIGFLLDVARRTSPTKYAADLARMSAVERRTGVNFQRDVLGQMGNNAAAESNGHQTYLVRVDVADPAAAARTLRKLGSSALDIVGTHSGSSVSAGPGDFETVHQAHRPNVIFGLVGSEFVAGTASPAQLRAFATAPAAAAPGAQGALAFRVALPQLLQLAFHRAPSKTLQQVLSVLGDITGWVSSSSSALTGSATLALR